MGEMVKNGDTRCFCRYNWVPFFFSDRKHPRSSSHWSKPSAIGRRPHLRRVYPITAIQPAKGARFSYPLPANGHEDTKLLQAPWESLHCPPCYSLTICPYYTYSSTIIAVCSEWLLALEKGRTIGGRGRSWWPPYSSR